jgi:hypothetical protein
MLARTMQKEEKRKYPNCSSLGIFAYILFCYPSYTSLQNLMSPNAKIGFQENIVY